MKKITIRPSSLDSFLRCQYSWYRTTILEEKKVNNRAAIGTGVHAGAEYIWKQCIKNKKKDGFDMGLADLAGHEAFKKEYKRSEGKMFFKKDQDRLTSLDEITSGIKAWVDDILPYVNIPDFVEKRFTVKVDNHPIIDRLSGTVDYYSKGVMADIKTAAKSGGTKNYRLQQSMYKYLMEANGHKVNDCTIQKIVFKKKGTEGEVLSMDTDVRQALYVVKVISEKLRQLYEGKIAPEVIFSGTPVDNFLCSPDWCASWDKCKFRSENDQ